LLPIPRPMTNGGRYPGSLESGALRGALWEGKSWLARMWRKGLQTSAARVDDGKGIRERLKEGSPRQRVLRSGSLDLRNSLLPSGDWYGRESLPGNFVTCCPPRAITERWRVGGAYSQSGGAPHGQREGAFIQASGTGKGAQLEGVLAGRVVLQKSVGDVGPREATPGCPH